MKRGGAGHKKIASAVGIVRYTRDIWLPYQNALFLKTWTAGFRDTITKDRIVLVTNRILAVGVYGISHITTAGIAIFIADQIAIFILTALNGGEDSVFPIQ